MHLLYGGTSAIMEDSCGGDNRHVGDSPAHPDILYPVQLQLHCVTQHTHTSAEEEISEITAGIQSLHRYLSEYALILFWNLFRNIFPAHYLTSIAFLKKWILFINIQYFPTIN